VWSVEGGDTVGRVGVVRGKRRHCGEGRSMFIRVMLSTMDAELCATPIIVFGWNLLSVELRYRFTNFLIGCRCERRV